MRGTTLWDSIDVERSKWWQYGAFTVLAAVLVVGALWIWASTGFDGRMGGRIIQLGATLTPIVLFPVFAARATRAAIKDLDAQPAPIGSMRASRSTLHDVSLTLGMPVPPELWMFPSPALNALVLRERRRTRVVVSNTFAGLPTAEQRAAFAMLLGRAHVNKSSLLLGSKSGIPTKKNGGACTVSDLADPKLGPKILESWLDVAQAGDQEALLMLREPEPILTLMRRLEQCPTELPGLKLETAYQCLTWPFPHARVADVLDVSLPQKAQNALAKFVGTSDSAHVPIELQRLARFQAVLPAAEREAPEPAPLAPVEVVVDKRANAFAAREATAHRISRRCPKCGADNVPTNHTCIACGKVLPAAT